MPGRGPTNSEKIARLEEITSNINLQLQALEFQIKVVLEEQKIGGQTAENHSVKIVEVEKTLLVLQESKGSQQAISDIQKTLVSIAKDLEKLTHWKDELKKEKDETARRLWAFGPNLVAALIGLLGVLISVTLTFLLRKP
jgi:hypothetical protein